MPPGDMFDEERDLWGVEPDHPGADELDRAIDVFLNRWVHNWRGERAVIEQELRDLIAQATEER